MFSKDLQTPEKVYLKIDKFDGQRIADSVKAHQLNSNFKIAR